MSSSSSSLASSDTLLAGVDANDGPSLFRCSYRTGEDDTEEGADLDCVVFALIPGRFSVWSFNEDLLGVGCVAA